MLNERDEALKELKDQFDNIKENSRDQIHLITLMADDYNQYAEDIAKLIINYIQAAPAELKLIGIYVMDSVIKFSGDATEKYRRLFSAELVKLFVDVFRKAPVELRQKLYKLRKTWEGVFKKSKLFELDNEIQKFDKLWQPTRNGAVAARTSSATSATVPSVAAESATSTKPATVPVAAESATSSSAASTSTATVSSKPVTTRTPIVAKTASQENATVAAVKIQSSSALKARDPRLQSDVSKMAAVKNDSNSQVLTPRNNTLKRSPTSAVDTTTKTIATRTPTASVKHSDTVIIQQRVIPEKKRRIEESSHPIQPTAALGAHAFLPPPILANTPPSVAFPMPPPQQSISPPLGAMHPIRFPKAEVIDDSWRSPATTPLSSQVYNQPPPPIIINSGPPPMRTSFKMETTSSMITNETPRHGSAPNNNRIFVDGRAYEVFYLNNEAVIEQNGLPHRIFFSGSPRDILIDGKPFKLAFDEVRMIHIDGIAHPIRFGAPSRELYIGDYPFRGAFGGPPMIANINGRRHEFRLCGPPPEVRIDQDPCYELARYMSAARGIPVVAAATPKQEEKPAKQDVFALLQKIKQHGILSNKSTPISASKTTTKSPATAALGSRIDLATTRDTKAPPSIKEFQIGALMVRYSDVIEALYRPRIACPHCGIGFEDKTSEGYQRHIDQHVQELLRIKDTNKSRSRKWMMGLDAWLEYDEYADVQKLPTTELLKSQSSPEGSPTTSSDSIPSSSLNKTCSVCFEKFNEYYDNDEEEWKFQDCVVIKGTAAIHKDCVEQMVVEDNENGFEVKQETATFSV